MLKHVDRLIVSELLNSLFLGLLTFSALLVATIVLRPALNLVNNYGATFLEFLRFLVLNIPYVVVLSLPMAVLLGTLLAFGRLSKDLEIVALRSAGIALPRMILPAVILALFATGLIFLLNEKIVPRAASKALALADELKSRASRNPAQKNLFVPTFRGGKLASCLFAEDLREGVMAGVKFFIFDQEKGDSQIEAPKAIWDGESWTFFEATRREQRKGDERFYIENFKKLIVENLSFTPKQLVRANKKPEEMSISELRSVIRIKREGGIVDRQLMVDYYLKFALPSSPIFLVLVGIPLSIGPQRSTSTTGFGISMLIVLLYYIVYVASSKFAVGGGLQPAVAAWLPNGILFLVGLSLIRFHDQ